MPIKVTANAKKPGAKHGKYPFSQMKPGDSFKVPAKVYLSAARSAYQYGKRHGKEFTARLAHLRIWRIA